MAAGAVTQVTAYKSMGVYDVDFSGGTDPTPIIHSFNSSKLDVHILPTSGTGAGVPNCAFTDANTITLTVVTGHATTVRVYISVIPD